MSSNENTNSNGITKINSNSNEHNLLGSTNSNEGFRNQLNNEIVIGNNENPLININFSIGEEKSEKALNYEQKPKYKRIKFIELENTSNIKNSNFSNLECDKNLQTRIKVLDLLQFKDIKDKEIINLLNQEVCFSPEICEEIKTKFINDNTKLETREDIINYITKEIEDQYKIFSLKYSNEESFLIISEYSFNPIVDYWKKLQDKETPLHKILIHLYTIQGFLIYSVNSILRKGSLQDSTLHLYFTLLQASIAIASKEYNHTISKNALINIGDKEYYRLYRGVKIPRKVLFADQYYVKEGSDTFLQFNEFLSTSWRRDVAEMYALEGELKEDYIKVIYHLFINEELAVNSPTLMCFIERISEFPEEFEVLLSSSTIFEVMNIKHNRTNYKNINTGQVNEIDYYDVTLEFVSNGFNADDFIVYSSNKVYDYLSYGKDLYTRYLIRKKLLRTNKFLKYVNLINKHIGDNEVKALAEDLKVSQVLKEIRLTYYEIGDEGAKALADALKVNKGLKEIDLSNNNIVYEGAMALADALKVNSALEFIYLSNNQIGDEGAMALADALKVNSALEYIYLNHNQIGHKGAKALADALKVNSALKSIYLSVNQIGDKGAKALADALKVNSALESIYLYNNQIGDEAAKALADALNVNSVLEYINLSNNQIGEDGANGLADALKVNSPLEYIYLNHNQIGDEGAKALADALKVNSALKEIGLSNNNIGDEGAKALADTLKVNSALEYIYLNHNQIGHQGAKALADALKVNSALEYIYLNHNQIGDEGAMALADALKVNSALKEIGLSNNKIGDDGAKALEELHKYNKNLYLVT